MEVVIVGAHGKIGRLLARRLAARGDSVRGLIRNPDHAGDLQSDGSEAVVCDLETAGVTEIQQAITGADTVVFAAGAGAGSGAARKETMDRDGAIKLLAAAGAAEVPRYVMVGSVGAESPPGGDDVFSVYLRAKAAADQALIDSDREWTIVRPVSLTDEPGAGTVRIDAEPVSGQVSRDDVAAVLAAVVHEPRSVRRVLYLTGGTDPVDQALDSFSADAAGPRS